MHGQWSITKHTEGYIRLYRLYTLPNEHIYQPPLLPPPALPNHPPKPAVPYSPRSSLPLEPSSKLPTPAEEVDNGRYPGRTWSEAADVAVAEIMDPAVALSAARVWEVTRMLSMRTWAGANGDGSAAGEADAAAGQEKGGSLDYSNAASVDGDWGYAGWGGQPG